jgi:hypothetical protein
MPDSWKGMSMRMWRLITGLVCTTLILAASAGAQHSISVSAAVPQAKKKPADQASIAKKLANRVYGAQGDAARYAALLQVMKSLHIEVMTAAGKVLAKSDKQSKQLALYDFELGGLAGRLGKAETDSLEGYAALLSAGGITAGGTVLDAAITHRLLRAWVQTALGHPTSSEGLRALLVRALGVRQPHPYDLAQDIPDASVTLDPLQETVILAAILASAGKTGGYDTTVAQQPGAGAPVKRVSRVPCLYGPCSFSLPNPFTDLLNWWNGTQLGLCVVVHKLAGVVATHYGPPGHPGDEGLGGKPMRFGVAASSACGGGSGVPTTITAGALAGATIPPDGPLAGIPVSWVNESENGPPGPDLTEFGTTTGNSGVTDDNGVETMVFTPKDEIVPGFGSVRESRGEQIPRLQVSAAFGHLNGKLAVELDKRHNFPDYQVNVIWIVSRHAPRGFHVQGTYSYDSPEDLDADPADVANGVHEISDTATIDRHVCGPDP